jgi:hypothetical protein
MRVKGEVKNKISELNNAIDTIKNRDRKIADINSLLKN